MTPDEEKKLRELQRAIDGGNGYTIVEDGGTASGHFSGILAIGTGNTFGTTVGNGPDLTGRTISHGVGLLGRWTSVQAAAGATNQFYLYHAES